VTCDGHQRAPHAGCRYRSALSAWQMSVCWVPSTFISTARISTASGQRRGCPGRRLGCLGQRGHVDLRNRSMTALRMVFKIRSARRRRSVLPWSWVSGKKLPVGVFVSLALGCYPTGSGDRHLWWSVFQLEGFRQGLDGEGAAEPGDLSGMLPTDAYAIRVATDINTLIDDPDLAAHVPTLHGARDAGRPPRDRRAQTRRPPPDSP